MGRDAIQSLDGEIVYGDLDDLKLDLSSKIDTDDIRIDPAGDRYAEGVYHAHSGNYIKLAKLYTEAAELCAKTLKNKKIDVNSIRTKVKKAKQLCLSQAEYCKQHRISFEQTYTVTTEIVRNLEK